MKKVFFLLFIVFVVYRFCKMLKDHVRMTADEVEIRFGKGIHK